LGIDGLLSGFTCKFSGEKIEICNSLGKIIETKNIFSENTSVDISKEATGIYFYRILSKDGTLSCGKFILE